MRFKLWECEQGSDEWHALRMGIPTASQFHRIITPKKKDYSKGARGYACELAIERLLGESNTPAQGTPEMERGKMLEPAAVDHYHINYGQTAKVGFISNLDLTMGCSPDRILIEELGGLEIKCPSAPVHADYATKEPEDYYCQVQGSMMITGFEFWDFISYHPGLPERVWRFRRNETFIKKLTGYLIDFEAEVQEIVGELRDLGEIGYGRTPAIGRADMNLASKIMDSGNWGG